MEKLKQFHIWGPLVAIFLFTIVDASNVTAEAETEVKTKTKTETKTKTSQHKNPLANANILF